MNIREGFFVKKMVIVASAICLTAAFMLSLAGCSASELTINIYQPRNGDKVTEPTISLQGKVSEPKAEVKVNGKAVSVTGTGSFTVKIDIEEGENLITISAGHKKLSADRALTIYYEPLPGLEIESPDARSEVTEDMITVKGTVARPDSVVTVNDIEVDIDDVGAFSMDVGLVPGENTIMVSAVLGNRTQSQALSVAYIPALAIDITSHEGGAVVTESPVDLSGIVTVADAVVMVNDIEADVTDSIFTAAVELTEGENAVTVTAVLGEETVTQTVTIVYEPTGENAE